MQRFFSFPMPQSERCFAMDDFDGRDFVVATACEGGFLQYEKPLPQLLIAWLTHDEGLFLDIGANTGLYSLIAAAVARTVSVVAFEPMADITAKLQRNVQLNEGFSARVTVMTQALSRGAGTMKFYETRNDKGYLSTSSSFELAHAKSIGDPFSSSDVAVTTLDAWAAEHGIDRATMIKIDVEGHEQGVLEGGMEFVRAARPLIVLELLEASNFAFFQNFATDHRYLNFVLGPDFIKMEPRVEFSPSSWNHAFCPAEKLYQFVVAARAAGLEPR
jgi:FkbM family methyltransferase